MALFERNLPGWERLIRGAGGVAMVGYAVAASPGGWLGPALIVTGVTMLAMGLVGFCPACALIGRRLHP